MRKLTIKNPQLGDAFLELLKKLTDDPFHVSLKTHPLKGRLKDKYACSLSDNLRIIFCLTPNTILLLDTGTHDEVY